MTTARDNLGDLIDEQLRRYGFMGAWDAHDAADEILAELPYMIAPLVWQPIETAPKDGSEIMLYGPCRWLSTSAQSKPKVCVGSWASENGHDDDGIVDDKAFMTSTENPYQDICNATHWMPLPAPPTGEKP
jgi:hypothetical protein